MIEKGELYYMSKQLFKMGLQFNLKITRFNFLKKRTIEDAQIIAYPYYIYAENESNAADKYYKWVNKVYRLTNIPFISK